MTMTRHSLLITIALVSLMSAPVSGQNLSGSDIAKKTKAALEPNVPSTRILTISINQGSKQTAQWSGAQARTTENGARYMVTAVLSPMQAKGMAVLARQEDNQPEQIWTYVPTLGRTMMLSPASGFAPLFGSDFTFADLGFMELSNRYSYLGQETLGDTPTYKIQETPANNPYYSKIDAWIRKADFLPVRRDFYNYAGALVQREDYGGIQNIDEIPTITHIKMILESSGNSTEFAFSDIQYNKQPPASLFDPDQLRNLAKQPFWTEAKR
jgi:outer membrane lipoprotein-sorting protein